MTTPTTEESAAVAVSDADFATQVLQSESPVLVDFWAPWCGPCQVLGPVIEEVAREFGSQATVAKMNVDENADVPQRYGIASIPTVMLFQGGQLRETFVGVQPAQVYRSALAAALSNA